MKPRIDLLEKLRVEARDHRRVFVNDVEDVERHGLGELREFLQKLHVVTLADIVRELIPDDEDTRFLQFGIRVKDVPDPRDESFLVGG